MESKSMGADQRLIAFFKIGGREVDVTSVLDIHPAFIIGSDPRSHLMLLEPSVAASHARVSLSGEGFTIVSCFPHLETCVNDRRIKAPTPLNPGDRVRVGEAEMHFLQEERAGMPPPVAPAALRARPVIVPAAAKASTPAPRYAAAPAPAALAPGEIFTPRREVAAASASIASLVLGLVALLALVTVIGFGIVGNQTTAATSSLTQYAYRDGNISVVMFEASWCEICKAQKPIVSGLEEEYRGDLYVQHIDTDDPANRRLVTEFNVSSIPRILIINDQGQISADFNGLTSEPILRAAINKALAESAGGRPA